MLQSGKAVGQALWELPETLCLSHLMEEHISGILHFDQLQNSKEFIFGKICSCFSEKSPWGWSYVVKHQCWPRFWKQSMKSQLPCQGYRRESCKGSPGSWGDGSQSNIRFPDSSPSHPFSFFSLSCTNLFLLHPIGFSYLLVLVWYWSWSGLGLLNCFPH